MKSVFDIAAARKDALTRTMPRARVDDLVVSELDDEVLVYDLKSHGAHALNRTTALVWRHCDGQTTFGSLVALLQRELQAPVDESVVWMALYQLDRARLLQERMPGDGPRYSRQQVLRTAGKGLIVLPAIAAIVAPTAAAAASCGGISGGCSSTHCCQYTQNGTTKFACTANCGGACPPSSCTGTCMKVSCT